MELIRFSFALCASMFVGIIVLFEIGRRVGVARLAADPSGAQKGVGAVEGSVFALVGLLIAFTFSGAASRFDARRDLIIAETNAIGTAWLRLDLLPTSDQSALRELFRQYLDSRLAVYQKLPDIAASELELGKVAQLQRQIWQLASSAIRTANSPPLTTLLMPALNDMFDIATTRVESSRMHPPLAIYIMLVALVLAGTMLVGYAMAGGQRRNWLHIACFATVMTLSVYVIIDIEYPRLGFIKVDAADRMLLDLRDTMH